MTGYAGHHMKVLTVLMFTHWVLGSFHVLQQIKGDLILYLLCLPIVLFYLHCGSIPTCIVVQVYQCNN